MTALAENAIAILLLSLVASALITLILIPAASRLGWVDEPDVRKVHDYPTPVVGGIAIFVTSTAVFLSSYWLAPALFAQFRWMWVGALLLLVTGLVDDRHHLSTILRFLLQTCAGLIMIVPGNLVLHDFGALFTSEILELGVLSIPITLFATLGVINAFNMIDGMDGLSCSILLIALAGMSGFAAFGGQISTVMQVLLLVAAVSGFLLLNARFPWNPKARAFLGNSGSMSLGFILAWLLISLGNGPDRVFMPMTAVWFFAVPLLDTSTLIWARWRQGESPFEADNQHLHHAFLRAGFSVETTWLVISGLALGMALVGVLFELSPLPGYFSFYTFMAFAFTYYFYIRHCWASQKFLGRHFVHHDFTVDD